MREKYRRKQKGFTIIELVIVMSVITILAAIALPMVNQYRGRGFIAMVRCDAKNVHTAIRGYMADSILNTPQVATTTGPGIMDTYTSAMVSPNVTVKVDSNGQVTASHQQLNGNFVIDVDGHTTDTLALP